MQSVVREQRLPDRRRLLIGASHLREGLITALVSALCVLPVALPALPHLGAPWGAGDMTYYYFMGSVWQFILHAPTQSVAFPFGMDPNAFSAVDGLIFLMAGAISAVFGNPFVGLNTLLLLSFPIVAVMAYCAIRLTGLSGPIAIALANAFTFIPYHFGRGIGHLTLGLMLGLASGVLLALLIGSGRMSEWFHLPSTSFRIQAAVVISVLVMITAWTGIYYAFFGLVLLLAALVWRISSRDSWRSLMPGLVTTGGLVAATGIGLASVLLSRANAPAAAAVSLRDAMDSVLYSGNLAIALIPQPYSLLSDSYNEFVSTMFSGAPPNEAHQMANYGSWVTSLCVVIFLIGLVLYRRSLVVAPLSSSINTPGSTESRVSITYVAYLLIICLTLFVPWSVNFIFAYIATAQIRAWNRLLPYVLLLVIVGASAALASWRWPRRKVAALVVAAALIAVTVVEMVLPWRNLYAAVPAYGQSQVNAARDYADQVNASLPEDCGVLTLPFVAYPGAGPLVQMDDYDHFLLTLTNPQRPISYGAYRESSSAREFERLSNQPINESVWELKSLGYCGVHVNTRGYEDPQPVLDQLASVLGQPVAEVEQWKMYALP